MEEVYQFLKTCGTYYLATMDGDQPRVRPFGTVDIYHGQLTIQTGRKKDVAKQMLANPKVEVCAFDGSHWLRDGQGGGSAGSRCAGTYAGCVPQSPGRLHSRGRKHHGVCPDGGHRHLLLLHRAQPYRYLLKLSSNQKHARDFAIIRNPGRVFLIKGELS